jgi:hypothetical protein
MVLSTLLTTNPSSYHVLFSHQPDSAGGSYSAIVGIKMEITFVPTRQVSTKEVFSKLSFPHHFIAYDAA